MTDTAFVFIYLPGQVRPTVAERFDLETAPSPAIGKFVYGQHANNLIDAIQQTVRSQWRAKLEACKVSRVDIERIAGCFDPPAFEAPPS